MTSRSSYASAPVVLRRLLELEPINHAGRTWTLEEMLASVLTAETISFLIDKQHDLRISATSIRRWREA